MTDVSGAHRAAIYARRSRRDQDESIDRQVSECLRFIQAHGWTFARSYEDTASGWMPDTPRPQFDAMLTDARLGAFDSLVVWEASRLSRREDDNSALAIIWRLRGMGVEVHSIAERATGVPLADDLALLIKSHVAKEESDVKSQRVLSGKRRAAIRGIHQGRFSPFGYDAGTKREHEGKLLMFYEPDSIAAPIVREIFSLFVDRNWSPPQIAEWLNTHEAATPGRGRLISLKLARSTEALWHKGSINRMLANGLYAGFAQYKGERVKACSCADIDKPSTYLGWAACEHDWCGSTNVPAIVQVQVWEEAQRVLRQRARPSTRGRGNHSGSTRFMLAGLLRCGECGERIGPRARAKGRGRNKYQCLGRIDHKKCDLPHIDQEMLDTAVRESFIRQFIDEKDVRKAIESQRSRIAALQTAHTDSLRTRLIELAEEERRLADLGLRAREDYERRALSADLWSSLHESYKAQLEEVERERAAIEPQLRALEAAPMASEVDGLIEYLDSVARIIQGHLTAPDVPRLNAQLAEVFVHFTVTQSGDRLIVEPTLRPEWLPEGNFRCLDFGSDDHGGDQVVEVVDWLEADFHEPALLRELSGDPSAHSCDKTPFQGGDKSSPRSSLP